MKTTVLKLVALSAVLVGAASVAQAAVVSRLAPVAAPAVVVAEAGDNSSALPRVRPPNRQPIRPPNRQPSRR